MALNQDLSFDSTVQIEPFEESGSDDFANELAALIPHLRAFARSLAKSPAQADDLVQDTMLRAWSARARYEPGTSMKAWTFTILRNSFFSSLRRRKFEQGPVSVDSDAQTSRASQPAHMELLEVQNALSRISPERRQALLLVGAAGMSYDEAAEVCGCPVGTIKSRVSRARSDLLKILDMGFPAFDAQRTERKVRQPAERRAGNASNSSF